MHYGTQQVNPKKARKYKVISTIATSIWWRILCIICVCKIKDHGPGVYAVPLKVVYTVMFNCVVGIRIALESDLIRSGK